MIHLAYYADLILYMLAYKYLTSNFDFRCMSHWLFIFYCITCIKPRISSCEIQNWKVVLATFWISNHYDSFEVKNVLINFGVNAISCKILWTSPCNWRIMCFKWTADIDCIALLNKLRLPYYKIKMYLFNFNIIINERCFILSI